MCKEKEIEIIGGWEEGRSSVLGFASQEPTRRKHHAYYAKDRPYGLAEGTQKDKLTQEFLEYLERKS